MKSDDDMCPFNLLGTRLLFIVLLSAYTQQLGLVSFLHGVQAQRNTNIDGLDGTWSYGGRNNFTHAEVAGILRERGYRVQEFPDDSPLVFIGDVAYAPEQVVPELADGRLTAMSDKKIWRADGVAQAWYFFDTETQADHEVFQEAVATWAQTTCIKFNKLQPAPCKRKLNHGSICVGAWGGCWSMVGNTFSPGRPAQKMSVIPNGCEMVAAAHEFGHALGIFHQQSRPDRDDYLHVKNENFATSLDASKLTSSTLGHTWAQGGRCNKDQVVDLPVPFDYMSLMQYATTAFADTDKRPVFLAKDGHYQYMLDYHRNAGMAQSFYDRYTVGTVYGCVNKWVKDCIKNGKTPPKCKNVGFIGKDCVCSCPPAYTGTLCEKGGPKFPLLSKAKNMFDVTKTETLDIGTKHFLRDKGDAVMEGFMYYQFFTVIVNGDPKTQASINVQQNLKRVPVFTTANAQDHFMRQIQYIDCSARVMWGLTQLGNIRMECRSTTTNNEPEGPIFRSKTNHMDMIYLSSIGREYSRVDMTIQVMSLVLKITLSPHPAKMLTVAKIAPKGGGGAGGGAGGGGGEGAGGGPGGGAGGGSDETGDSGGNITGTSAAERGAREKVGVSVGVAVGVLLLLLLGVVACLVYRHKKHQVTDPNYLLNKLYNLGESGGESSMSGDGSSSSSSASSDESNKKCVIQ